MDRAGRNMLSAQGEQTQTEPGRAGSGPEDETATRKPGRPRMALRLASGGAILGALVGAFAGALLGGTFGAIRGDLSLGLDGAVGGSFLTAALGGCYGLVLALWGTRRRHGRARPPQR